MIRLIPATGFETVDAQSSDLCFEGVPVVEPAPYSQAARTGGPISMSGFAFGRGEYFWKPPLSTSAT